MNNLPDNRASSPSPPTGSFALLAAAFEGGVGLVAIGLGWLLGFRPLSLVAWTANGLAWGIAASIFPLLAIGACVRFPRGPMRSLVRMVDESIAPMFGDCNLIDMASIALLAGLGEELLFRGLIQGGLSHAIGGRTGMVVGLASSSALFAVLHWLSATYAVLAGLIGLYLALLLVASGNLLVPMTAHAVYDFVMVAYLVRVRRHD